MTTEKVLERVPPYLTQLPTKIREAEIMIESLGPCWWRDQNVNGVATTKAKRKAVESQLMTDSLVLKYVAAVSDTGAKAIQSQDTMMFNRTSWKSPKNLRLYTLYSTEDLVVMRESVRVMAGGSSP